MDEVTQRTAANAEESASASEELNTQSKALIAVVERLQALTGADSPRTARSRKPVAPAPHRDSRAIQNHPRLRTGHSAARKPALAGLNARNAGEFPLDDSEFKEF